MMGGVAAGIVAALPAAADAMVRTVKQIQPTPRNLRYQNNDQADLDTYLAMKQSMNRVVRHMVEA